MHCSSICIHFQLGEATFHCPVSLEPMWPHYLQFEYPLKSFCALPALHSLLAIAFELYSVAVCQFREWYFILHLCFSFFALVDKAIHLLLHVFLVASAIFGFCIISYTELQSCLLTHTPFIGVTLVLNPYIVLYMFIFDRPYCSRILPLILCTLGNSILRFSHFLLSKIYYYWPGCLFLRVWWSILQGMLDTSSACTCTCAVLNSNYCTMAYSSNINFV